MTCFIVGVTDRRSTTRPPPPPTKKGFRRKEEADIFYVEQFPSKWMYGHLNQIKLQCVSSTHPCYTKRAHGTASFLSEKVPRTARRYGDRMAHRPFLFLSFPLLLHPSIQPYKLLALIQFWDYASWDDGGKKRK